MEGRKDGWVEGGKVGTTGGRRREGWNEERMEWRKDGRGEGRKEGWNGK